MSIRVEWFNVRFGYPELLIGLAGLLSGAFAAFAYYNTLLRPLSHTFTIWIALVAVVAARQAPRQAILRAVIALLAAVIAFYVGKKVVYDIKYPGTTYNIDPDQVVLWCILATIAGTALGLAFHNIGRTSWRGATATAAAIGVLVGDACRRATNYSPDAPVVITFTAVAAVTVLLVGGPSPRQLAKTAALSAPFAILGYALASAPDVLEQLLFTGGL